MNSLTLVSLGGLKLLNGGGTLDDTLAMACSGCGQVERRIMGLPLRARGSKA